MTSTLIVGYGAFGNKCARLYTEKLSIPVLLVDNQAIAEDDNPLWINSLELSDDSQLSELMLKNAISDYRNILVISSLGGTSFAAFHELISHCARELKISLISLCTIPFSFESERRLRALDMLGKLPQSVRNIFIVDSQKHIRANSPLNDFMEKNADFVIDMIGTLSGLLESSPFFTLCTETQYTMAFGSGVTFSESVLNAIQNPMFDATVMRGKAIICSESLPNSFESEQALSLVMSRFGVLPEIVVNSSLEKNQVLLFIPISCHSE